MSREIGLHFVSILTTKPAKPTRKPSVGGQIATRAEGFIGVCQTSAKEDVF